MHKPGWLESELRRVIDDYPHAKVSEPFFQMLVAEAFLVLLERTKPSQRGGDTSV